MTILEKIKHDSANEIRIYLEGVFWVAYEQSAYWFWQQKAYKPTKKFVKSVGQEVVSIGFPKMTLASIGALYATPLQETGAMQIFSLKEGINMESFLEWKNSLVVDCRGAINCSPASTEISVAEKIRNFPLESKTPMECMLFLSAIKNDLR